MDSNLIDHIKVKTHGLGRPHEIRKTTDGVLVIFKLGHGIAFRYINGEFDKIIKYFTRSLEKSHKIILH